MESPKAPCLVPWVTSYHHGLHFLCYADDTHLYISLLPYSPPSQTASLIQRPGWTATSHSTEINPKRQHNDLQFVNCVWQFVRGEEFTSGLINSLVLVPLFMSSQNWWSHNHSLPPPFLPHDFCNRCYIRCTVSDMEHSSSSLLQEVEHFRKDLTKMKKIWWRTWLLWEVQNMNHR